MALLGSTNTNATISSVRIGSITSATSIGGSPWGSIHSGDTITIDSVSARQYIQVTYTGLRSAWICIPAGYFDNSNNYPLFVNMPGYGESDRSGGSFSNVNNASTGWGPNLLAGDDPNALVIIPENLTFNIDYGSAEFAAAIAYMVANYRVNTNRVYATGLSGGAIGCKDILQNATSTVAAIVLVSGPTVDGTNWAAYNGIGYYQHHGTADSTFGKTIGGTLYWANGFYGSAIDNTPAPRSTYYYNIGHSSTVWYTNVFNRLERTDTTGTAAWDFVRFCKKFSKDASEQATLFVTNAEETLDIVDYRESLMVVNNLASGGTKTGLLSRLATLKPIVDKGGNRYVVSPNKSGTTVSTSSINDWNATFAGTQGLSNITDDSGGASSISFTVTNQFASSSRDNLAGNNNSGRSKYKGFKLEANLGGLVLSHSITNGTLTITNVPSGKTVDILLHHSHLTGDDDDHAMSAESTISATANSITKTQYSAYNNGYYLAFTNVPEVSGSVVVAMKTVSTRDVVLTGFELLIHS